jgi:predicted Zn-dependent peptidase
MDHSIVVKQDANPIYMVGFHKPTLPDRADYVFDVINTLLSSGRSSRLYKRLVKEERIAAAVDTFSSFPGTRYSNSFGVLAVPMGADKIEACGKSILAELDRLKTELVPPHEFEKVVNKIEMGFLQSLDSNSGLAENLSYFQAIAGDWRYIDQHSTVIRTIKPEEIQEAATRYFRDKNRTVAVLLKDEAPAVASTGATQTTTSGGGSK